MATEPTKQEIQESIEYLDRLEKGQASMDFSAPTNGGKEEKIALLKSEFNSHIQKAKAAQAALDKIEKGEGEGEEKLEEKKEEAKEEVKEEKGEEKEEKKEEKEKPAMKEEKIPSDELKKSWKTEILDEISPLIKAKDNEILELRQTIEKFGNEPIKKSLTSLALKEKFEKAEAEGKTPISKSLNKNTVSRHLYNLFVETTDELEKAKVGEAILQYESADFLSPELENTLSHKYNLTFM